MPHDASFDTRGRALVEITRPVADWVSESGIEAGLLTLFIRHTSASRWGMSGPKTAAVACGA